MDYWKLIRPLNCLLAGLSVILGFILCPSDLLFYQSRVLFLASMSAFLITGFGNVVNDILDQNTDLFNRPSRPLPSGRVSVKGAQILSAALLFLGLVFARSISTGYLIMAFLVALLLFLYNVKLKSTVLWGNILVAFLTGFTLIYGGLLTQNVHGAIIPALFAFLINLVREVIKDIEDMDGDIKSNVITLPIKCGEKTSRWISISLIAMLVLLTYFPIYTGAYSKRYLYMITLVVNLPLGLIVVRLIKGGLDKNMLTRLSSMLKLIMLAGFASILMGRGGPWSGVAFHNFPAILNSIS